MVARLFVLAGLGAVLAGCAELGLTPVQSEPVDPAAASQPVAPPATAQTAEAFDTTTEAERAAAAVAPAGGETRLGETVASLGDPAEPGFWLRTALVDAPAQGRIVAANGGSVQVELIPSDGEASSGSEVSLAALRLLDLPLTELAPLDVLVQR